MMDFIARVLRSPAPRQPPRTPTPLDSEAKVRRGREADMILRSEVLQQAFAALEAETAHRWVNTRADQVEEREECWRSLDNLAKLRARLATWVREAKNALGPHTQDDAA